MHIITHSRAVLHLCLGYEQIGRLNMELDWLKKKAASSG